MQQECGGSPICTASPTRPACQPQRGPAQPAMKQAMCRAMQAPLQSGWPRRGGTAAWRPGSTSSCRPTSGAALRCRPTSAVLLCCLGMDCVGLLSEGTIKSWLEFILCSRSSGDILHIKHLQCTTLNGRIGHLLGTTLNWRIG